MPSPTPNTLSLVERPTQADRDAAKLWWEQDWHDCEGEWARLGLDEQEAIVRGFARHRLAAVREAAAHIEALEKALRETAFLLFEADREACDYPRSLFLAKRNVEAALSASVLSGDGG